MKTHPSSIHAWLQANVEADEAISTVRALLRHVERSHPGMEEDLLAASAFCLLFERHGHTRLPLGHSPRDWASWIDVPQEGLPDHEIGADRIESLLKRHQQTAFPFLVRFDSLYRRRMDWKEETLARRLLEKAASDTRSEEEAFLDDDVRRLVERCMGDAGQDGGTAGAAAWKLLDRKLLLLTGGPGTGKTTALAGLLAFRLIAGRMKRFSRLAPDPRIALCASTGKAAARMASSIRERLAMLQLDPELEARIPTEATTLHRLLQAYSPKGLMPSSEICRLPVDLIVVDEASMIDIHLMMDLLSLAPREAAIVLVGDPDQLPSVEQGDVLADLASSSVSAPFTVKLTRSRRFRDEGGIHKLSHFIRSARGVAPAAQHAMEYETMGREALSDSLRALFSDPAVTDIDLMEDAWSEDAYNRMQADMLARFQEAVSMSDEDRLAFWKRDAWLSPLRKSPYGVDMLNAGVERRIVKLADATIAPDGIHFHGRPVLVTRNDPRWGISNGDAGVCLYNAAKERFEVLLDSASGLMRRPLADLPHLEPGFFMTVHKAQGSEYEHVHLLLPPADGPLLSNQMLFTAVTRARSRFTLHGSIDVFAIGMSRRSARFSGLAVRLEARGSDAPP